MVCHTNHTTLSKLKLRHILKGLKTTVAFGVKDASAVTYGIVEHMCLEGPTRMRALGNFCHLAGCVNILTHVTCAVPPHLPLKRLSGGLQNLGGS